MATAKTPLKPLTDAVDNAADMLPGTNAGAALGAPTSDLSKRAAPAAFVGVGVVAGWAAEKATFAQRRDTFGYADQMTPKQRTARNLARLGIAVLGLGMAAAMENHALQFAGLGIAGVQAAHLAQDAAPALR